MNTITNGLTVGSDSVDGPSLVVYTIDGIGFQVGSDGTDLVRTLNNILDDQYGNATFAGTISGDGAGLTGLAWANLTGTPTTLSGYGIGDTLFTKAVTGDVTLSGTTSTVGANKVTNAKAAQMAANTIKGNNTSSTANAADLTVAQVKTLIGSPIAGSFSGTGTATTSFVVTIGSTMANSTYKVNVTPTDALSAALFYISTKTTTTFTVTYLSGLTGTVAFDWSVFP